MRSILYLALQVIGIPYTPTKIEILQAWDRHRVTQKAKVTESRVLCSVSSRTEVGQKTGVSDPSVVKTNTASKGLPRNE